MACMKSISSSEAFKGDNTIRIPCNNQFWFLLCYNQDQDGDTQLHLSMAQLSKQNCLAHRLIEATWPPSLFDVKNNYGMTALHIGAMGKESDTVRQLLIAGANPLIKDNNDCIPLHYACINGDIIMVRALTNIFDTHELKTMKGKKIRISDLCLSIRARNNRGETPLHLATEFGHLNIVKHLVEMGANLDSLRYRDGQRPLQIAMLHRHVDVTKYILDYYQGNPSKQLNHQYSQEGLLIASQDMGLDTMFIKVCNIPVHSIYCQESSDDDDY